MLELERQLRSAGIDRCIRVAWSEGEVRSYADDVFGLPTQACVGSAAGAAPASWRWEPTTDLSLVHGTLSATLRPGGELRPPGILEVRTGACGVRCRPAGRAHTAPLNELLRRRRIPPWERRGLPLLYAGGVLVAVADLFVCEGFQASVGEVGLAISWQPRWRG